MARQYRHAQPFLAPTTGTIEERLSLMADQINLKADANSRSVFTSIVLVAPDKSRWVVSVTNTGALVTEQIT